MRLEGKRVLLTGGAGFIGSHVARAFLDAGATVDVVDDLSAGQREFVPERATLHEVDVRAERCRDVVRSTDPDVLLHLAALHYVPYCNEHPEETFEVNVMGTRNLLRAARALDDLQRVVYASSAAVYPPSDEPHRVTDEPGPTDVYGRTKLVGEDLVELFVADAGVPAVSARLFNVYGPNETNPHLIPAILDQVANGARSIELGNLEPARDFVYVDDVAEALLALTSEVADGYRVYNVGTGEEHTVREVAETVGEALGDGLHVRQTDDRVRESDRPHLRADTSHVEAETSWQPRTEFVDGLRTLLEAEGLR